MSAEAFLDTNVLVYSFDPHEPEKQQRAKTLIAAGLDSGSTCISWQVVQEFLNVAMHKWPTPLPSTAAREYCRIVLQPLCTVYPSHEIWQEALHIHDRTQYRLYDSLIVASAIASGAARLLSEDLQAGRRIGGVVIENPFAT